MTTNGGIEEGETPLPRSEESDSHLQFSTPIPDAQDKNPRRSPAFENLLPMDQAPADQVEKAKSLDESGSSSPSLYPKLDPRDLQVPPISTAPNPSSNSYVIASPVGSSSSKREFALLGFSQFSATRRLLEGYSQFSIFFDV